MALANWSVFKTARERLWANICALLPLNGIPVLCAGIDLVSGPRPGRMPSQIQGSLVVLALGTLAIVLVVVAIRAARSDSLRLPNAPMARARPDSPLPQPVVESSVAVDRLAQARRVVGWAMVVTALLYAFLISLVATFYQGAGLVG